MRLRFILVLLSLWSAAAAGDEVRSWVRAHEKAILAEYVALLAIPNVATDAPNIQRNADMLEAMLEARGLAVRQLRLDGVPPLVVGDLRVPGAARTISFYAHYDGQPVDESKWTSPPWTPVMRDAKGETVDWAKAEAIDPEWRLYARSAGDDKVSIMAMLAALDALRASGARPAVNLRFVFEGEEEAGSAHLGRYLERFASELRTDAWLLCDGPVHPSRRSQLVLGVRGVMDLEMTVYGPLRGLHDGHYGNWAPNPAAMVATLLAGMRNEEGTITIDGFYDDVRPLSDAELGALAKLPSPEGPLRAELALGRTEGEGRSLAETLMLPAMNVRGIEAGRVGEKAANAIPTEARASIDFRLVPAQTPAGVRSKVEAHLAARGWHVVHEAPSVETRRNHAKVVRLDWGSGYPAARTSPGDPFARELIAIMKSAGHDPVVLPTLGGSIPMYLFQSRPDLPVVVLPIANHDNSQHAANENLRLQNLWDGIEIYAALFRGLK